MVGQHLLSRANYLKGILFVSMTFLAILVHESYLITTKISELWATTRKPQAQSLVLQEHTFQNKIIIEDESWCL